jgi:hypothetical protein
MTKPALLALAISCALDIAAQVPVKNEPRHHNVFENEYIRVLDVHFGPKDTTMYHIHSTPSVFYTFTKTITTQQLLGRPAGRGSASVTGPPSYDSLGSPRTHRVWNDDTSWFHVMDVELTASKPTTNPVVLQHPLLRLAFNRYLANGYSVQLNTGDKIDVPASSIGYLFVSQGDANITYQSGNSSQQLFMKAGHFIWVEAGKAFTIAAKDTSGSFMLLQLK